MLSKFSVSFGEENSVFIILPYCWESQLFKTKHPVLFYVACFSEIINVCDFYYSNPSMSLTFAHISINTNHYRKCLISSKIVSHRYMGVNKCPE